MSRSLRLASFLLVAPRPLALGLALGLALPAHAAPTKPSAAATVTKKKPARRAQGRKPAPAQPATPAPAPPKEAAPADPARVAVERMQGFYEATAELHARFEQELISAIGKKKKASGDVWLKKPGKMRWEYQKPEKRVMVADGKTLWVYEPEDEQAFKQELTSSALPSSVTFLFGTGRLTDEFDVSLEKPAAIAPQVAPPGTLLLKLVPRKPTSQYRYMYFAVDDKDYKVAQSWVYDQQGGINHLTFLNVQANTDGGEGRYQFTPPPGTKILTP